MPVPADNPQTPEKIALGEKLFNDKRFSSTGMVSCANCHAVEKAFTDGPLEGFQGNPGSDGHAQRADGDQQRLHEEALLGRPLSVTRGSDPLHPFLNPVEMGLKDHQPILEIVSRDTDYQKAFQTVFGKSGEDVSMRK